MPASYGVGVVTPFPELLVVEVESVAEDGVYPIMSIQKYPPTDI
jgi:hypothetical protein